MSNKVFAIAGWVPGALNLTCLSTVSYYDITTDTWEGISSKLNIARCAHSACTLQGIVYVFCGTNGYTHLNSIEMISETSLVQNSTALWQIIEIPQNILIPCKFLAVAPINDTEISIMGGFIIESLSDVFVFNTATKCATKLQMAATTSSGHCKETNAPEQTIYPQSSPGRREQAP